jgi:hypothetical protein
VICFNVFTDTSIVTVFNSSENYELYLSQLPRKRAILPQPCPLCGRTDGNYQYVIFNHKNISSRRAIICRIGHYDKNYYLSRKESRKLPTIGRKIKRPYGRIWHSFKVRPLFNITRYGKMVNLSQYFDTFKEKDKRRWKTSLTIKPELWMSDYIRKWGWQMIPEESLLIARRKVKEYYPPMPLS